MTAFLVWAGAYLVAIVLLAWATRGLMRDLRFYWGAMWDVWQLMKRDDVLMSHMREAFRAGLGADEPEDNE